MSYEIIIYNDYFYRTKFNRLHLYCLFYKTVSFKKIEGKLVFNMLELKQKAVGILCQGSAAAAFRATTKSSGQSAVYIIAAL